MAVPVAVTFLALTTPPDEAKILLVKFFLEKIRI
jgi:hypothetical protein